MESFHLTAARLNLYRKCSFRIFKISQRSRKGWVKTSVILCSAQCWSRGVTWCVKNHCCTYLQFQTDTTISLFCRCFFQAPDVSANSFCVNLSWFVSSSGHLEWFCGSCSRERFPTRMWTLRPSFGEWAVTASTFPSLPPAQMASKSS